MTRQLLEPILEGGIRHVHFFNGRRLTAEDLEAEQAANHKERTLLGLAVGSGIVSGFEVSAAAGGPTQGREPAAVLRVRAGTAVNALGEALTLPHDQFVTLAAPDDPVPEHAGRFGPCEAEAPVRIDTGSGAYVLVVSPASGFEGRVPAVGFDSGGQVTGCGSRYSVSGVKFRVVPVPLPQGPGDLATLRNRLAHLCFGTEALLAAQRFPPEGPGADWVARAAPGIRPSDVPLALFYWSRGSLLFVDMWSVRRRVAAPYPASQWLSFVSDSRQAVAEAVFLQFQEEVDWLAGRGTGLKSASAAAFFRYLPAAGFLPVGHNEFDARAFFSPDRFPRQVEIEGDPAFVRALLFWSLRVDPIDVDDPPPIAVYHLRGVDDYIFFMRQDASVIANRRLQPVLELPAGGAQPEPQGAIEVDVALAQASGQEVLGERALFSHDALSSAVFDAQGAMSRSLKITAVDELGNVYEGRLAAADPVRIATGKRFARAVIEPLRPGTYKVAVQSSLFRPASRLVSLDPGARERILIELLPRNESAAAQPTGVTPPKTARAGWLDYGWYDKIAVIDAYVNPTPLPEHVRAWEAVTDPPPDVKEWLVLWADAVAAKFPGAPIDPAGARILIRPDYTPGDIAEEPYAFIEFGEKGAHVPVVLVPTHTSLDGPVSVHTAGVPGIDQDVGMRLWQLGAGEVDIAASAWSGLLRDAGFAGETAVSVIREARRRAEELKTSVRVVPGVDAALGATLAEKGIDTAVKLANADPARLEEELGIDRTVAGLVVSEARRMVPEESWSLRSSDLGLSDAQVKALEEMGVTTKGVLAAKPAEEISEKIGVARDDAGAISEKAGRAIDAGRIKSSVQENAPVAVLKEENVELGAAMAKSLAKAGVKSLKDVVEADENRLAELTGDPKTAEKLIRAARARLGLSE